MYQWAVNAEGKVFKKFDSELGLYAKTKNTSPQFNKARPNSTRQDYPEGTFKESLKSVIMHSYIRDIFASAITGRLASQTFCC